MSQLSNWKKLEKRDGRILWETVTSKGVKIFRWSPIEEVPMSIEEVGDRELETKKLESKKSEMMDLSSPSDEKLTSEMTDLSSTGDEKVESKHEFKLETSGRCDRCKEEVKFKIPECKNDKCGDKKTELDFTNSGTLQCSNCKSPLQILGSQCPSCSYYIPAPGETFDASRVNFDMSSFLDKIPGGSLLTLSKHEMPCPTSTQKDISKDLAVNEWVFNHLPLTGTQKKELLNELTVEKLKEERGEKREKEKKKESERLKESRIAKPKLTRSETRQGVKSSQF